MTSTLKWAKICPPWRGSLHGTYPIMGVEGVYIVQQRKGCRELIGKLNTLKRVNTEMFISNWSGIKITSFI